MAGGQKVRHDFAAGEETISGSKTHIGALSNARDETSSLNKANHAALGEDVVGSQEVASNTKQQFERDELGLDSARKMESSNQRSQDIQHSAASQARNYFGNKG